MMNVRNFLIAFISATWSFTSVAQSNLLNAKTPDQIGLKNAAQLISDNDKPLAYGYVHDRDILMGKTTWEIIDLSEKINFPLYFPIDTVNVGSDRRSLYDVLTKAMKNGRITEVYTDSYFNTKKSIKIFRLHCLVLILLMLVENKLMLDRKFLLNILRNQILLLRMLRNIK